MRHAMNECILFSYERAVLLIDLYRTISDTASFVAVAIVGVVVYCLSENDWNYNHNMRILTAVGLTNHCINNLFICTDYDFEKDQHFSNLLLKLKIGLQFEHILQLFFLICFSLFFRMSNFSARFFT